MAGHHTHTPQNAMKEYHAATSSTPRGMRVDNLPASKTKSGMNINAKPTETDIKRAYSSCVYHGSGAYRNSHAPADYVKDRSSRRMEGI